MVMIKTLSCAVLLLGVVLCGGLAAAGVSPRTEPPFVNSVVSNDLVFILDTDPDAQVSFRFVEVARKEMPDSRPSGLFADAYVYEVEYATEDGSGKTVEIWANRDFGNIRDASLYARLLARAIGQQPELLRDALGHVVLHNGDATAFAEERGGFFVIYSENMDTRISTNDLPHTVFHECAHVALETAHATAPAWITAQQADPGFLTRYAEENPVKEDIPESALFAFAVLNHPGRLPAEVEAVVRAQIPNRLAYFEGIDEFVAEAECTADVNGDGEAGLDDFDAWIAAFQSGAPACDQNGDALCTPADFNAWIINFNAGCV